MILPLEDLNPKGPVHAHIEPTTRCNFRCLTCVNLQLPPQRRGHLTLSKFQHILESIPSLNDVSLLGLGEPLLNPDLLKMAQLAKQKGITIRTVTNGSLLHQIDSL